MLALLAVYKRWLFSIHLFMTESKKELDIKAKEMTAESSISEKQKTKSKEVKIAENSHNPVDAALNGETL